MVSITRLGAFTAALLLATAAHAAGGKDEAVKGDKGAGAAPAGPTGSGVGETGATEIERDKGALFKRSEKKWEVGADFEAHRLLIQNDLQGVGPDKFFNYYGAHVSVLPTKSDIVTLAFGAYQRFIADPNETGFRLDDLALRYTHYFALPAQSELRAGAAIYFPTSFGSQLAGTLGAGRLTVGFQKIFGKYVLADVGVNGTGYLQQYDSYSMPGTTMSAGAPNPIASLSLAAEVVAKMPFHTPLSVGLEGYTGYTWYYQTNGALPAGSAGATADNQFSGQPMQQAYGGEVFVGYKFPDVYGFKTDLHLAFAEGDPALGYTSALHDGISHAYIYWRESSEVYGSISLRY